jgi:CHAD domain-containing protein
MSYHFKRDESVPETVRRIALEELESVADQLGRPRNRNHDEAIHEARKSVKKVRALLRLLRTELGDQYRAESRGLREVGRKLSELRDAGAVIEIFDTLKKKYPDEFRGRKFHSIRRVLVARRRHAEEEANLPRVQRRLAESIKAATMRVKTWRIRTDGFAAIERGFEKTFRAGRTAFALAQKRPRPENYHEWRKRLKDHWYHIRLLENVWTDVLLGYENSLKVLETWLGDDHNLVLLHDRLVADPESYGDEKTIDLVLRSIDKYQKELRDNAESFGNRIHLEGPRRFTRRMRKLWQEWRAEPTSVEHFEKEHLKRLKKCAA